MNPSFSHYLVEEILLRLPVKSLLRFKCVCKAWLSLISDPNFAKSHFDLAAAPTYRILHKSKNHSFFIRSIDTDAALLSDSSVLNLPTPLPSNASFVHNFRILGCCQGFLVLNYDNGDLMLWNPSTDFHKHIPYRYVDYIKVLYGFGYDASTDDYLIIIKAFQTKYYEYRDCSMQIWGTRLEFFSLKTNSWNELEGVNFPNVNTGYGYTSAGSFLNGTLHWLALSSDKKHFDAIVAYDLKQRSLSEIPMPYDLTRELTSEILIELTIMKGCLSLCCNLHKNQMVEIWMMKEYRVESSWTKSIVLSTRDIGCADFYPMCFTKGGEIIGSTNRGGLAKFNHKGDLLEHRRYDQGFHLRCVLYTESLLSSLTAN